MPQQVRRVSTRSADGGQPRKRPGVQILAPEVVFQSASRFAGRKARVGVDPSAMIAAGGLHSSWSRMARVRRVHGQIGRIVANRQASWPGPRDLVHGGMSLFGVVA